MISWIPSLGSFLTDAAIGAGYSVGLLGQTMAQLPTLVFPANIKATFRQLFVCGIQAIPVTLVVSIFTGAIVAMNTGMALQDIGQQGLIGRVVAVSMAREMGPFMTGLTLAASVGYAMAAEIRTMKVSEEIDALEVMGIDPARFLVLPRLVAMAVMTPILTVYVVLVGTIGGMIISASRFDVSTERFLTDVRDFLEIKDIYTGVFKAFVFGIVIAVVGCSQGLRAWGGAIGVGRVTRQSVVTSFLLIIILGYYVTFVFFGIKW